MSVLIRAKLSTELRYIDSSFKTWLTDPRLYQIAVLGSLLFYGTFRLDFEVKSTQAVVTLATVLLTQYLCARVFKLPVFDPRSPLISGLSLCLLLRTNSLLIVGVTAFVTIASKFVLRWKAKHIFNPTNFGIVLMILLTDQVWVSPGQWGNLAFFGFLIACLGGLVVNRASRSDVTYAFLAFYISFLSCRALWLGDPTSIPIHQIQNGAFLIFTFFMISDPKTTPDSRTGRILFAFLVSAGAFIVQFFLFKTNGLLWSLAFFSLSVPLIDWLLPGGRYEWKKMSNEIIHEKLIIQPQRH
ncbi:MAG: RnfABCDGE type electron transport complex subunit D [Thermodesulfobacteriota bacterium]